MNQYRNRKVLAALALALSCSFSMAHAASSKYEQVQAKRQAERDAAAKQAIMTQAEIDQLIATIPKVHEALPQLDIPELNKEQQHAFMMASMEGHPTVKMIEFISGTDALDALNTVSKDSGYTDYLAYAKHFDIAFGVLTSDSWIQGARGIVINDEKPPAPIENLWEFIHDESQPEAEREKLSTQLDEMLPRFGTKSRQCRNGLSQPRHSKAFGTGKTVISLKLFNNTLRVVID